MSRLLNCQKRHNPLPHRGTRKIRLNAARGTSMRQRRMQCLYCCLMQRVIGRGPSMKRSSAAWRRRANEAPMIALHIQRSRGFAGEVVGMINFTRSSFIVPPCFMQSRTPGRVITAPSDHPVPRLGYIDARGACVWLCVYASSKTGMVDWLEMKLWIHGGCNAVACVWFYDEPFRGAGGAGRTRLSITSLSNYGCVSINFRSCDGSAVLAGYWKVEKIGLLHYWWFIDLKFSLATFIEVQLYVQNWMIFDRMC